MQVSGRAGDTIVIFIDRGASASLAIEQAVVGVRWQRLRGSGSARADWIAP